MWKLLPWSGRGASGYPQRECFFCCTTSIILPPYTPHAARDGQTSSTNGHASQPSSNIATWSTTTISTGTPTNWFCSNCHSQNVTTDDGTPVEQYTRPMWDEEWNRNRSQLLQHTRPSKRAKATVPSCSSQSRTTLPGNSSSSKDRFNFCHTCQTNQVLTLNMLADYLPSEDDPEYQQKLQQLPAYEASIATRYPAVCADCAPKVHERISERDQFARSWSLGKWLHLKKKASLADIAKSKNVQGATTLSSQSALAPLEAVFDLSSTNKSERSIPSFLKNIRNIDHGSRLALALFVLVNASVWVVYLTTCFHPTAAALTILRLRDRIQSQPYSSFTATIVFLSLYVLPKLLLRSSHFDPLKRWIDSARARQIRVEASGLQLWRMTQLIILCLRLLTIVVAIIGLSPIETSDRAIRWLQVTTQRDSSQLLWLTALTMLINEIILTTLAASQLRVQSPTPLQLVSKPIVANGGNGRFLDVASDPLLTSLSLDDQAHRKVLTAPANSFGMARMDSHGGGADTLIPAAQRDADGDAVMEDAATYSERRASVSSEDDWEQTLSPRLAPPPASSWSSNWSKASPSFPYASGLTSMSSTNLNPVAPTQRSASKYTDFQLGPQRFWEPENPTGLEDVFGRAVSLDDQPQRQHQQREATGKWSKWFGFS